MKTNTIPITFKVVQMQADQTEYLQRSVELEPLDLHIVVELEPKKEYFADPKIIKYWADIKVAEVTGGDLPVLETPSPIILTPAGMAEVRRLVNDAFRDTHPQAENTSDNWDDDEVIE